MSAIVLTHPDGGTLRIELPAGLGLIGQTLMALGELGWGLPHQTDGELTGYEPAAVCPACKRSAPHPHEIAHTSNCSLNP